MKNPKFKFFLVLIVLIGAILSTIPGLGEVYDVASGNIAELDEYLVTYEEGNLPETYVNVTLDATLGCFETLTYENEPDKDIYYYLAWLNDDSFISMGVYRDYTATMDKLTENTWDLVNGSISYDEFTKGEKLTFIGKITSMDSEEERFYRSALAEYGIDDYEYNVRYQSLSIASPDYVYQMIFDKFIIQIIVALAALYLLFKYGKQILKARKQIRYIESSVQDYDPTDVIKKQKVVSGKEAMARVSDPYLQKYLKGKKKTVTIAFIIIAVAVLIPLGLFTYSKLVTPSASASKVYVMDNSEDYSSVKDKSVGEITISYPPVLVYTGDDSSMGDYAIYPDNGEDIFIAELDDDEFKRAVDEIRGTGSTTLHGYYDTLHSKAIENAVDFYNDYYGGDYDTDDFNELFGYYCLVVDDNYNGIGIASSDIDNAIAFAFLPIFIAIVMLVLGAPSIMSFKKEMSYLTDGEYARLESELNSPETKAITKQLYLTDKYIFSLGSSTSLISYSDILWAYPVVQTQYKKEVSYEIRIHDRRKGQILLMSAPAGDDYKALINDVLGIIATKNPNARIGYNQANVQAAAQMKGQ